MKYLCLATLATVILFIGGCSETCIENKAQISAKQYILNPIGKVVKEGNRTMIVLDKKYQPGLMRLDEHSHVTVLYWFDRNDTPEKRSILQVHPRGNKNNPLTGVFATHSPVRPNLIAISRCKIISIKENVIEIEGIDAFPDSPVLDLKS